MNCKESEGRAYSSREVTRNLPGGTGENQDEPQVRITGGVPAENRTEHLPNTNVEALPVRSIIRNYL
jgi:hypothetical protein